jgi:hypothetical protein
MEKLKEFWQMLNLKDFWWMGALLMAFIVSFQLGYTTGQHQTKTHTVVKFYATTESHAFFGQCALVDVQHLACATDDLDR